MQSTADSLRFALANLRANDAEVRAKAIKVIGRSGACSESFDLEALSPLLKDPVWFVRLLAVNALGNLKYCGSLDTLGTLLLDPKWQVRNAAARALANIGDGS
jgi:HEAT repeat protein